ncbi:MAG: thioredoxin [Alphaproteobacteria bacterium]
MDLILKGAKSGGGKGGSSGQPASSDLIKEGDAATFVADVIDASRQVPVIVDMWAPWCGPCKQLGPLLEKLVRAARGALRMVKINVDKNQNLAAQLRVQSIPAVFAFRNGQLVDGFVGALPESQIKAFIQRLMGDGKADMGDALAEAKALLDQGDTETADRIYRQIIAEDPGNVTALGGVLRCHVALGELDEARELMARLPADMAAHADIVAVRTSLELAAAAPKSGAIRDLASRVAANPDDHQARHDLALAHYAAGDRERAVDELLEIVRRDRTWDEDGARRQLVKLFEAFGPTDPLTVAARRRLSTLLFS